MNFHDDSFNIFESLEDFKEGLQNSVGGAEWLDTTQNDIQIYPCSGIADQIDVFSHDWEIYIDTCQAGGTGLYAKVNGRLIPIGASAMASIKQRARINGSILNEWPKEFLAEALNKSLMLHGKDPCKIYICQEKIRAVPSKAYIPVDMPSIFAAAKEELENRFSGIEWLYGYMDHDGAVEEFKVCDSMLLGKYSELFQAEITGGKVRIVTSNTGDSGANLHYCLLAGENKEIVLSEQIRMAHRRNAHYNTDIAQFRRNVQESYAKFVSAYRDMEELSQITITHPNDTLITAMSNIQIPKTIMGEVIQRRQMTFGDAPVSALSLYRDAQEIIVEAKRQGMSTWGICTMQERVARLAHVNWAKIDHPTVEKIEPERRGRRPKNNPEAEEAAGQQRIA